MHPARTSAEAVSPAQTRTRSATQSSYGTGHRASGIWHLAIDAGTGHWAPGAQPHQTNIPYNGDLRINRQNRSFTSSATRTEAASKAHSAVIMHQALRPTRLVVAPCSAKAHIGLPAISNCCITISLPSSLLARDVVVVGRLSDEHARESERVLCVCVPVCSSSRYCILHTAYCILHIAYCISYTYRGPRELNHVETIQCTQLPIDEPWPTHVHVVLEQGIDSRRSKRERLSISCAGSGSSSRLRRITQGCVCARRTGFVCALRSSIQTRRRAGHHAASR